MNISPARRVAFDIILRIEKERSHSSVLLAAAEDDLPPIDRPLCHELVLGTLRNQLLLDKLIDKLSAEKKLDMEVRIALRLAFYQLRFLTRIPAYSAINESVGLVQRAKKTSAKGFVNAVLRRYSREGAEPQYFGGVERVSVETSHPRWLLQRWIECFGLDEACRIAVANNAVPPLAFRPLHSLEVIVDDATPSENAENCYIADGSGSRIYALAKDGEVYIQDEASQMAAQVVTLPSSGRVLDVCAAPGGKTGLIAFRNPDAKLVAAGDIYSRRVEYLRDNCRRQGEPQVAVVQYDAENILPFAEQSFDAVLVDAPCSGTGTIRHNPEIRYLLTENDITELSGKQLRILTHASKVVSVGGLLVYSTCSIEKEEDEDVCIRFLEQNADFIKVGPRVPEKFLTADGFARTWPHRDNMDGFFIAAFRRK